MAYSRFVSEKMNEEEKMQDKENEIHVQTNFSKRVGDFSSIDSVLGITYDSISIIKRQLAAMSSMMMDYCDNLGELLHIKGLSFYIAEDMNGNMDKMLETLKGYRKKVFVKKNEKLIYLMENEIEKIENVFGIAHKISGSKTSSGKEIDSNSRELMKLLLNSYSAFDSFIGNDEKEEFWLESIIPKIYKDNFKNLEFNYSALSNEKVFATKSIAKVYSKLVEFLKDNASQNARIVFSAENKGDFTYCEAWCSSHKTIENQPLENNAIENRTNENNTPSGNEYLIELIKSDWRLLIAEYVLEKNDSAIEMSSLGREYLDIRFSLRAHGSDDSAGT